MKTVFVLGVHGVGKNYLCKSVVNTLGIPHYGASELIKQYNASFVSSDKSVKEVTKNQDVLVSQYHLLPTAPLILMDGHCCLLKDGITIERIPMSIFEQLDICGIVLVSTPINTIIECLLKRDGIIHDKVLLSQMVADERNYSKEIAEHLNVPLLEVESTENAAQLVIRLINEIQKDM